MIGWESGGVEPRMGVGGCDLESPWGSLRSNMHKGALIRLVAAAHGTFIAVRHIYR
jgi:hypothetical protein